jgi:RNA polymerase sigma factor (sigma-70 family)
MMMQDDMALVRAFAVERSEPAFAALVERHVSLVHSAALRQTGDPDLAGEITQAVFLILARKAPSLGSTTILSAWLHRTTGYAAADAVKARRRRQAREQEAYMQSTLNQPEADPWAQLAPLLDDALAELGETDRAALVLRYFENKTAREIAAALQLEEAAAQKRVARALDKLRARFARRGVTLAATVIAGAVAANSVAAAPAGLTVTVTGAVMKGAAVAASTTTLSKGALKIMAWTKAKTVIVMGAVILTAGTAPVAIHHWAAGGGDQGNQFTIAPADLAVPAEIVTRTVPDGRQSVQVHLQFTKAKADEFRKFSRAHINQQTRLLVGSKVVAQPYVRAEITGPEVSLSFSSVDDAQAVVDLLTKR